MVKHFKVTALCLLAIVSALGSCALIPFIIAFQVYYVCLNKCKFEKRFSICKIKKSFFAWGVLIDMHKLLFNMLGKYIRNS